MLYRLELIQKNIENELTTEAKRRLRKQYGIKEDEIVSFMLEEWQKKEH